MALVGAFSVITNLRMELFGALGTGGHGHGHPQPQQQPQPQPQHAPGRRSVSSRHLQDRDRGKDVSRQESATLQPRKYTVRVGSINKCQCFVRV